MPRESAPSIHLNAIRAHPTVFLNVDRYSGHRENSLDHHDKALGIDPRFQSSNTLLAMHADTMKAIGNQEKKKKKKKKKKGHQSEITISR